MRPASLSAAGAVVWREREDRLEVLLVHRPRYDDWSWPKGKPEVGEALPVTAVREVAEETGFRVVLAQPVGTVRYSVPGDRMKETRYWAATAPPPGPWARARPHAHRAPHREIDGVVWVDSKEAWHKLSYRHDRDPLARLIDQWQHGRLDTWTVAVVRHARARKRAAWQGGEDTRPLTGLGLRQAQALTPLLSAFGISELVTSPWERCAATLRPYEMSAGIAAEPRWEITEEAHRDDAKPVRQLVDRELSSRGAPVAICTHRRVLPTVVAELAAHAPDGVRKQLPGADPWLKPGEVLLAHMAGQRAQPGAVAVETLRPGATGRSPSPNR